MSSLLLPAPQPYRWRLGGSGERLACAPTELKIGSEGAGGAPGRNRTCCLMLRRHALSPVSYRRAVFNLGTAHTFVLAVLVCISRRTKHARWFGLQSRRSAFSEVHKW